MTFCSGLVSSLLLCGARGQTNYAVTSLIGPRSPGTFPVAINNGGEVVGTYTWLSGAVHSFIYYAGALHDLATPSGYENHVTAINNCGQIVGYFQKGATQRAYLRSRDGQILYLGSLDNSNHNEALGINDCGTIVGFSGGFAFVYQNGHLSKLGTFQGLPLYSATCINNRGQIVALYPGGTVLYSAGHVQPLPALEGSFVVGTAINDHGTIVGVVPNGIPSEGSVHDSNGFIYSGGSTRNLGLDIIPTGIKNSGQIIGYYRDYLGDGYPVLFSGGPHDLTGPFLSGGIMPSGGAATGMNESGQIIGYGNSFDQQNVPNAHPFIGVLLTPRH